jgi:hypothetical protein
VHYLPSKTRGASSHPCQTEEERLGERYEYSPACLPVPVLIEIRFAFLVFFPDRYPGVGLLSFMKVVLAVLISLPDVT